MPDSVPEMASEQSADRQFSPLWLSTYVLQICGEESPAFIHIQELYFYIVNRDGYTFFTQGERITISSLRVHLASPLCFFPLERTEWLVNAKKDTGEIIKAVRFLQVDTLTLGHLDTREVLSIFKNPK